MDTRALFDLSGKSALVTGASGAFGAAAARALAAAGAHVTLSGANEAALRVIGDELGDRASIAIGRPADEASAGALVAAAAEARGLDILVAASGTSVVAPALDLTVEQFDRVQDANVRQSWLIARAAGRVMIAQGRGGRILFVSSVRAAFASPAGTTAYGASKAAVDMLTRSFAAEWGKHGITANAIAPTIFRSELTAWMFSEAGAPRREKALERIPLGRLAEPEDFAGAVIFLSAKAGAYVTGEVLRVDGGFSAN
ncbi:SDR family NAD(P)-dependent oxidoreductase [Sphingomonas immobilis]|uniref:SDR family oxidoreductase n=1 Tax=Sphingomonas immobilis TaxID=3063997 RepID=A0ABT8ZUX1_9SPHN|nr:SDR family oxidoreductase [Sphingomonas sp. CA1-15]MDO7840785.1 SDR family oxidoreductase [Sphingomonas sp. CA1-15]